MKMTDDMAFELSGKSRNLLEQGNAGCPEQLKEWFDDWCRISFDGDVQSFHRRLSLFAGATALAERDDSGTQRIARWVREIEKINALMPTTRQRILSRLQYDPFGRDDLPEDFFSFIAPVIVYLENRLKPVFGLKTKNGDAFLEEAACQDIVTNGTRHILQIYDLFSLDALNDMAPGILPLPFPALKKYYDAFSSQMLDGGLAGAFHECPVLGKMTIDYIDGYVGHLKECLSRMLQDSDKLRETFGCSGEISRLGLSQGDSHNGGRSVVIAMFANRVKVVYKPGNGRLDKAFEAFTDYLAEIGAIWPVKLPKLVCAEDYCFKEFMSHDPLPSKEAARRYYHRAGQLLCVATLLGASDLHAENVIAHGEYPVIVDLETVVTPVVKRFATQDEDEIDKKGTGNSILDSGLLFARFDGFNGDKGGIAVTHSDGMNVPFFADRQEIDDEDICSGLKEGFEQTYRAMLKQQDSIIEKLNVFSGCDCRFLVRPTQLYVDLLKQIRYPDALKDGMSQGFEIEKSFSAFSCCPDDAVLQKLYAVYEAEFLSLVKGDVPYFYTSTNKLSICSGTNELYDGYFEKSALENARECFRGMSESGLSLQLHLLKRSLAAVWISEEKRPSNAFVFSSEDKVRRLTVAEMLEEAERIFQDILDSAIRINGEQTWFVSEIAASDASDEAISQKLMDNSFYNGFSGLSVFAGALYQSTGQQKYRDYARKWLEKCFQDAGRLKGKQHGGVTNGLGGLLMASALLAQYLNEPQWLVKANALAEAGLELSPEPDYMSGLAGYIMALDRIGARATLMTEVAEKLLALAKTVDGFHVWQCDQNSRPLLGFGHGQSGCALALKKVFDRTHERKYLDAALSAMAFERQWHREGKGWPDLRLSDDSAFDGMCGFCTGGAGIGLASLDMTGISREIDEWMLDNIGFAIESVKRFDMQTSDTLCCGNMSRVHFLVSAGIRLDRPDLIDEAVNRMSWVAARKKRFGHYILNTKAELTEVGWFNGLAGVGYELLRLVKIGQK